MDTGVALVEKAIALNPNNGMAFRTGALCMVVSVRPKKRLITSIRA